MSKEYEYHTKQFKETKRGTVLFIDWLASRVSFDGKQILDMACGGGHNTIYLGERFPSAQFRGIEYDENIIRLGEKYPRGDNVTIEQGDWFHIDASYRNFFDGIVCFQSLSFISDYKEPIKKLCELNPEWIALTSLFYEGRINFYTHVEDGETGATGWDKDGKLYYNVYSLPMVQELFASYGYTEFEYQEFEIDIDLEKPATKRMQTYTQTLDNGKRIQISGALLMPWYFVLARRV